MKTDGDDQEGGNEQPQALSREELERLLREKEQQIEQITLEKAEKEKQIEQITQEKAEKEQQIEQITLEMESNTFVHTFKDSKTRPTSLAGLEEILEHLAYPLDLYDQALSKYTRLSTKGSISYTRASALSCSALRAGASDTLNMSSFRREKLADRQNDFSLSRASLSNTAIRAVVCHELFSDDDAALERVMASNCERLMRIRTMYAYEDSKSHSITEESHLQPAAQLFFHALANDLPAQYSCIPANDFVMAFNAKFSEALKRRKKRKASREGVVAERKQENDNETTIRVVTKEVQGASDLLFCVETTTTLLEALEHGRALIELKSPFRLLLSELAYGQKDQTAAEIAGFIRTRTEAKLDFESTIFVGALTDLFSLHLFCGQKLPPGESDEDDKFRLLISDRVVSVEDYVLRILYLLVLGLKKSMFHPETMQESVQPEPIDPDYEGDGCNSEGASADDESGAEEETEAGGQSSAPSQTGSKKRSAVSSAGGGETKRKKTLTLSSVLSSELSPEEEERLDLIYEDARRTRHLIACGDISAYLGAQELETWAAGEGRRVPWL
eukprot:gene26958-32572_t